MAEFCSARSNTISPPQWTSFAPPFTLLLTGADNLNFGHSCGTCRMGVSDKNSVIDTSCKVHGMENVYVVDASFFPTSAGVNPSLTIAANAIRVAELITKKWPDLVSNKAIISGL